MSSTDLCCSIVICYVIINITTTSNMCAVQTCLDDHTTQCNFSMLLASLTRNLFNADTPSKSLNVSEADDHQKRTNDLLRVINSNCDHISSSCRHGGIKSENHQLVSTHFNLLHYVVVPIDRHRTLYSSLSGH